MDFFEAVEKRYSHKERFLPNPVPLKDLEKIAGAGLLAPTGVNSQCVRLIILPDRAAVQSLCEVSPAIGLSTAPAAIAVLTSSTSQGRINFEMEDYAAATAQMLLAITALGYTSVWLDSPYFDGDRKEAALKVLGVPPGYSLRVVLPVGLPEGPGNRRSKMSFEERVSYGAFGKPKG